MTEQRSCDICSRSELELLSLIDDGSLPIELDEDGLWVCRSCRDNLVQPGVSSETGEGTELTTLIGKSAGAICHTLNLPYEAPYQSVIDAASRIAYDEDRFMSAWSFVSQWTDGTTVWRSEGGDAAAIVTPDGKIHIRSSY